MGEAKRRRGPDSAREDERYSVALKGVSVALDGLTYPDGLALLLEMASILCCSGATDRAGAVLGAAKFAELIQEHLEADAGERWDQAHPPGRKAL